MTDTLTEAVHAVMEEAATRAIRPRYQHLGAGEIIEKAAEKREAELRDLSDSPEEDE